jgi:hypothetical protein
MTVCPNPLPPIQSLSCLEGARRTFIEAELLHVGGDSAVERFGPWQERGIAAIHAARSEIIARGTNWLLERELIERKLSVTQIRDGACDDYIGSPRNLKDKVAEVVDMLIASKPLYCLILKRPIKNTNVPMSAARSPGAGNLEKYGHMIIN